MEFCSWLVDTITGGVVGTVVGAGAVTSTAALLVTGAVAGVSNYAAKETWNGTWKERTVAEHSINAGISMMSWMISTVTAGNMANALRELAFHETMVVTGNQNQISTLMAHSLYGGQEAQLAVELYEWRLTAGLIAKQALKGSALPALYGYGISATQKITEALCDILYDFECIE